ncbi:MAG: potassium transporter Kup [Deltaproteobacteria bacterium]|nr:potassium transporter Kup [Deltaproteobacteria bacterium]
MIALGALGVVFGDIGTSPLYAMKECVTGPHAVAVTRDNIFGILSLIFWSLTLVVALKYLAFIMRADNRGEGGILALLALVPDKLREPTKTRVGWVAILVLFGAALLYGDGIITPAISVLSAVEGLEVATTTLKPVVVPLTCLILLGLFAIQSRGTEKVGRLFGPVMILWFLTLAVLGVINIVRHPGIFLAVNPIYAVRYFVQHGWHGITVLGAVVLTLTGGEALYADMGHFGKLPIKAAWYAVVMPSLVLCYFGQGALLVSDPSAASHPFFAMISPGGWTYALVALSTVATIIASQALISGAYSLTSQAVQLGYFPRVSIKHTSQETEGQIYVPEINWAIAIACIALVLIFKESGRLAAAYGLAVTGTMTITSIVFYVVVRKSWNWPVGRAMPILILFLCLDLPFLAANLMKFVDGGYVPVIIAVVIFVVMIIWKRGRALLALSLADRRRPVDEFLADLDQLCAVRVPGTSVFLTSSSAEIPAVLLHHIKHNRVLTETVVLLTVVTEHVPWVADAERHTVTSLGSGIWRMVARYGFMQKPDVPEALHRAIQSSGVPGKEEDVTYYIGRETLLATDAGRMGRWSESLFAFLARNARPASSWFSIPPERIVELGVQLDL